jgi:small-conductance mechanosensitive channel
MKAKYKNNSKSNLLLDNRSKMYVPITPDENWREEVQILRSINKELKEK